MILAKLLFLIAKRFSLRLPWKNIETREIIAKTVETSSQTGAIEMFQMQNNYVNIILQTVVGEI